VARGIRTALARFAGAVLRELDASSVVFLTGLAMLGYGIALVSPPTAWAVVGAVVARVAWGRARPLVAPRGVR
jgi:hypothetical protein